MINFIDSQPIDYLPVNIPHEVYIKDNFHVFLSENDVIDRVNDLSVNPFQVPLFFYFFQDDVDNEIFSFSETFESNIGYNLKNYIPENLQEIIFQNPNTQLNVNVILQ